MAKFSEIIGGIAKDLVQVQVSSDLSSMEILSHYKGNEIMKNLDIPRFTLSNVTMKLKFAISQDAILEQTDSSVNYVQSEWYSTLQADVLNEVLESEKDLPENEKTRIREEFVRAAKVQSKPDLDMRSALDNKTGTTVTRSTSYLMDTFKKLPEETRRKLPAVTTLKKVVQDRVTATLASRLPTLQKVAGAKAAVERNLEIIVEKAELEKINSEQIHEIDISLSPDFIKFAQDEEGK